MKSFCNSSINGGFTPRAKNFCDLSPMNNVSKPGNCLFRLKACIKDKIDNSDIEDDIDNNLDEKESPANIVKDVIILMIYCY